MGAGETGEMSAADGGDMPMRCRAEDNPPADAESPSTAGGVHGLCVPGSHKVHVSRELGCSGNVRKEEGMSAPGGKTGGAEGETICSRTRAWARGCWCIV